MLTLFLALLLAIASGIAERAHATAAEVAEADDFKGLTAVSAHLAETPRIGGVPALAAAVASDGTWRLAAPDGRTVTASGRYELRTALRWLPLAGVGAPATAGDATDSEPQSEIALLVAPDGLATTPGALALLPKRVAPHTLIEGRVYPVRAGEEGPAYVVAHGRLLLPLTSDGSTAELLWHLRRRTVTDRTRLLALDPEGAARLGVRPPWRPFVRRNADVGRPVATVEKVMPEALHGAWTRLDGQLVILAGAVRDGELLAGPKTEPDPRMRVTALVRSARAAGVELLIVDTASPTQPGSRNVVWQPIDVARLERARKEPTLGHLLTAIAYQGQGLRLERTAAIDSTGGLTTGLSVEPRAGLDALLDAAAPDVVSGAGAVVVGVVTGLVARANGDLEARSVTAALASRARLEELRLRIVPWAPSWLQFGYLALIAMGLLAIPTATRWFHALWPPLPLSVHRSDAELVARRGGRILVFLFAFLPVVALAAVPVEVARLARAITARMDGEPRTAG
ncbi:MAG: hypothetical protein GC150_02115 [Rhizobiales bacterium]|nr:hypothetical protein [Hyphomicrobiales bacterium]